VSEKDRVKLLILRIIVYSPIVSMNFHISKVTDSFIFILKQFRDPVAECDVLHFSVVFYHQVVLPTVPVVPVVRCVEP